MVHSWIICYPRVGNSSGGFERDDITTDKSTDNRPMLGHEDGELADRIDKLYRIRYPEYLKAHCTVKTDNKEVESIVDEIVGLIDNIIGSGQQNFGC